MDIKEIKGDFYVKDSIGQIYWVKLGRFKSCSCDLYRKEKYCFHLREVEEWKKKT